MSSADPVTETMPPASGLLFYQRPEALTPEQHADLRLKREGSFAFSKSTNSVAISASEFAAAMRFYPIVFAAKGPHPLVVLGLETENLFVGEDGQWQVGSYIPAYIRRYPFVFITHPDGQQFVLGIDRASELLEEGCEGRALFEAGKPSEVTAQALAFCGAFQSDHAFTAEFGAALEEQNLLFENQAQAQLSGGKTINLQGFRVVDRRKFAELSEAVIIDWHKKGWLALVHYHLASLERFAGLLDLAGSSSTGT